MQEENDPDVAHTIQNNKILIEQVKMLYESMTSLLLINLAVSFALVYAFWHIVSQSALMLWLGIMVVVIAARTILYYRYRKRYNKANTFGYIRFLVLGSLSAGILWGAAGIIMFPPQQPFL